MAKRITQETFEEIVTENVEVLDLEPSEAIEAAVEQFEAQGVDLSNILKDFHLSKEDGTSHAVLNAIETLKQSLEPLRTETVQDSLRIITEQCNIDLPHRCLAGSNQGFHYLFKGLQLVEDNEDMTLRFLEALWSILNGQPDIMNADGIEYFSEAVKSGDSMSVLELCLRVIRFSCVMHETNRQAFVAKDIITSLVSCLQKHRNSPTVVKEACSVLKTLTLDDDVRVPFGKAHEHARMIVSEANALKTILDISQEYTSSKPILGELFSTLGRLAVKNEFCQEIMDLGGLDMMMRSLESSMDDKNITRQILGVLKTVAGNDNVKVAIIKANGAEIILAAMAKHQSNPQVCENGCAALGAVSLRNPANAARIMAAGGAQGILRCMEIHKTVPGVQKQACMAIRNVISRNPEYGEPFLEYGAENLINRASANFKDCNDEAKAALRDLGCKVELRELWKGEHRDLDH